MVVAADRARQDRVAIVTGGSRGLGRATIQRLVRRGYAVVVNYVHDQRTADSTVDAVVEGGGAAVAIRADVGDDLDVERLFAQTIETFGGLDAVVHAVRGQVTASPLTAIGLDEFIDVCETSIRAAFIVNRLAARQVRDGGAIVNVFNSVDASVLPTYGAYATTTAALDALTRVLAVELRQRDIAVNGVSLPVNKPCAPGTVADVVAYLLSVDGHAVTGHVIHLDDCPREL